MSIIHIAKCTHCDYTVEYKPDMLIDYRYRGLGRYSHYPQIEYAWCNQCEKFVPVQLGINANKIDVVKENAYNELIKLENKIIKTAKTKWKIEQVKSHLFDTVILASLIDGCNTATSCLICGNSDVVFKDVKEQIWLCPKCKVGFLTNSSVDDGDDNLYRRSEQIVIPKKVNANILDYIIPKVILCSFDMLKNEGVFYRLVNNRKMIMMLGEKMSFIDRISLIYAVLVTLKKMRIDKSKFMLYIVDDLESSKVISTDEKHTVFGRIKEKIEYFISELEVELQCSSFIPSAILKTLENPSLPSTRNITGVKIQDVLKHWKIIIDTVQGYFKYM